ncbi:mechanosensitive ion channel family protein (plasmid) [Coraliomargarita sp. W4R53]
MTSPRFFATFEFMGTTVSVSAILWAVGILVLAVLVAVLLRQLILRHSRRQNTVHASTWYTLSRLVMYSVLAIGILMAISALGIPLSEFSLLAGAIGVGLGFGLQALFANFISGIVLLLDKSLTVGDFVELESGVTGEVRDIKIRATAIVTNDNIDILVPNSEFVNGRVVNWTHRDAKRRLHVPFGVAYGTDKDDVKQAALEAAAAVPFTLDLGGRLSPQVWLTEFGESSLNFELVVWLNPEATKRPAGVTAAYNWALHSALGAHGIEIPFPQRDLNVRGLFEMRGAEARRAAGFAGADSADENRDPSPPENGAASNANDAIDEVAAEPGATAQPRDGESSD